jgi:MFS superfamily sulfate permease-like transporter
MFYILAALLILVFFLPDLIGTIPALICGAIVIGFAIYVYNLWKKTPSPLNNMSPDNEEEENT